MQEPNFIYADAMYPARLSVGDPMHVPKGQHAAPEPVTPAYLATTIEFMIRVWCVRTATHRNAVQHTAARCNALQHTTAHCNTLQYTVKHRKDTQQYTSTHYCNTLPTWPPLLKFWFVSGMCTLQHTATHCNTLQHTATHCNTLQHITMHCNTSKRHTATHYYVALSTWPPPLNSCFVSGMCTLQHIATHCTPLQYTATYWKDTLQQITRH